MASDQNVLPLESLSGDGLIEVCQAADVIACECPGYLARLLRQVRSFKDYTTRCIEQFPQDKDTHLWLADQAEKLGEILQTTMIDLMRKEDLIDDADQILLDRLSERARSIALKQLGGN
jgi:hypothetical protein